MNLFHQDYSSKQLRNETENGKTSLRWGNRVTTRHASTARRKSRKKRQCKSARPALCMLPCVQPCRVCFVLGQVSGTLADNKTKVVGQAHLYVFQQMRYMLLVLCVERMDQGGFIHKAMCSLINRKDCLRNNACGFRRKQTWDRSWIEWLREKSCACQMKAPHLWNRRRKMTDTCVQALFSRIILGCWKLITFEAAILNSVFSWLNFTLT